MNRFSYMKVFFILVLTSWQYMYIQGAELLFNLDAHDELCFYEHIKEGEKTILEFQVIEGGNLDCDMTLTSPSGQVLYSDTQKQYDSYSWTTKEEGIYSWCFSNKFSTFTSKKIYFDFLAGDEPDIVAGSAAVGANTAMTALEMSAMSIHESLKVIEDYQKHHRLREMSGRAFAEDMNHRVMLWSVVEFICILFVMISQVFTLRSFFAGKKDRVPS